MGTTESKDDKIFKGIDMLVWEVTHQIDLFLFCVTH